MSIPDFSAARLLVVGDLMLDRYWSGATGRISPEAPVPVVRVDGEEVRAGGAGNVALNAAALGGQSTLLGFTGQDEEADLLGRCLQHGGVDWRFLRNPRIKTLVKLRILSRNQQLIRLDFEDGLEECDWPVLREQYNELLSQAEVVVLSDYAKGTLADPAELIRLARCEGKKVLVDPKGDDFRRYRGASALTPNREEFEAVVGPCADEAEVVRKAEHLRGELDLEALLVTRGEKGVTLVRAGQETVHFPTRAREVYDVTGAGDTVIATLGTALAAGESWEASVSLANLAAGVVVGRLGTVGVTPAELRRAQLAEERGGKRVLDEEALALSVADAQAHGERVVFTNGCFDLLHAGHVAYLEEAAALGDRLVVAVNDDDSVQRLKGEGRPVNPLDQRMAVLAGLAAVDWVVPFSEDTPARLIERLRPDVLAKGGDYRPEAIAGYDTVTAAGGEVVVLPYREGCSSSRMMEAIRQTASE
ncbi:heptose 1-phosphate adenyltransferase [Thiohalorhabdus denitrificans]|uniref:Bifunctional protein HldE n=1 Tax=Thiohalorhabdus denitrificans TaxID=381306 RepID=A0A0N8PMM5_9GAMM|nr:bifunctional D-glycero-beta-D-manno-heptose-7-phosphate kinase/D-glycero-beta-D-manno-heptose 1-phosphate adenylyltransferase HldE [Thiohalorhabdus denitrificans]KPV39141.1 heptose 1-phosphate adenyltransferase [Thiohalorhabdus denitrificans]SCX76603.1 D-alpha,beta-D-heptose 7-phosphate 1-kinase /D-beta-D-heptose 1-phosphate adenylyltransferase [Thiohalorhabdus denitrificans]